MKSPSISVYFQYTWQSSGNPLKNKMPHFLRSPLTVLQKSPTLQQPYLILLFLGHLWTPAEKHGAAPLPFFWAIWLGPSWFLIAERGPVNMVPLGAHWPRLGGSSRVEQRSWRDLNGQFGYIVIPHLTKAAVTSVAVSSFGSYSWESLDFPPYPLSGN